MNQEIIRINLNGVNCYLLKSDNKFILIDTGGHIVVDEKFTDRRELLENTLEKEGCTPDNLKLILLTHGHNDHICNVSYIRDKYKAKIAIHKADSYFAENPNINDFMRSFKYRSFVNKLIFKLMYNTIYKVTVKTLEDFIAFIPDILIDENLKLAEFGFEGKIVHLPGHTPGSVGVLTKEGDLISGDTLANMKKPVIAPNAVDFKLLHESINKLKEYTIKTVYPGHGDPFEFENLKL